jgi:hypothetical protein
MIAVYESLHKIMNRVVHFEIHAKDMDKLQKFYQGLFGWEFQAMGEKFGGYRVITTGPGMDKLQDLPKDPGINGGMTPRPGDMPTAAQTAVNAFVNVIGVQDTDATFKKALELGGSVAAPPMDVPNVGRLAYIKDPEYNVFGILQPKM